MSESESLKHRITMIKYLILYILWKRGIKGKLTKIDKDYKKGLHTRLRMLLFT